MSDKSVFISYAHSDVEWARNFATALQERGVEVWFDLFRVSPGANLKDALEEGMRHAEWFIAVLTLESLKRPNLYFELGAALGMNKKVIAVVPEDLDPALLPEPVRVRRYLIRRRPEETADQIVSEAIFANTAA